MQKTANLSTVKYIIQSNTTEQEQVGNKFNLNNKHTPVYHRLRSGVLLANYILSFS